MVRITFSSESSSKLVVCEPCVVGSTTLLAIARRAEIPLLSNCEAGGCGACVVELTRLSHHREPEPRLTEEEALFLSAASRPTTGAAPRREGASRRLACQYVIGPHDLEVRYRTTPGAAP